MAGPRIRTLKPEILEDEKTAPLSDTAFRLFTSMVILSDDWGNVRCDVRWLQAQVWWAHEGKPNVLAALVELYRATLIDVYAVRGGTYAHLRGWEKHQRIDNAGKNRVPKVDDPDSIAIQINDNDLAQFAAIRGEIPRLAAGSGPGPGEERDGDAAAKSPPAKSDRKRKLSEDWSPRDEERQSALSKGLDFEAEVAHFRDHHTAKGTTMQDWDAALRTWLRNAIKFGRGRQGTLQNQEPRHIEEL